MRLALVVISALGLVACRDETMQLPSGLTAELAETLVEPQPDGQRWLILRVVAPGLAERPVSAAESAADTAALCESWGVSAAEERAARPDQIVVQVMSALVERGSPAPEVTQIFAGYRLENDTCIWEDF